ncbi:hypothetical protein PsorP6_003055 [Peronosclerospora sorghi]|uniref:Uncharacterized protein n=1 Tax=Peronosclerospora sorghi TaxID=230839 RepID=A0ACC0VPU5_9STRA|nr:hypothetical protein PsorP6_003055 [Peronosclerospora sorghi]
MDDSIKSFDARLAGLTTMFRFMYQCIDSFLFHCGDMAIGDTNLFIEAMELLFRQVTSSEHLQAIKRLVDQRSRSQRGIGRYVDDTLVASLTRLRYDLSIACNCFSHDQSIRACSIGLRICLK